MGACSKQSPSSDAAAPATPETIKQAPSADTKTLLPTTPPAATLVNKLWVVAESPQVAIGSMRVFLSDGVLVMADPGGTPAFGSWRYQDGKLTIMEDGQAYAAEILELSPNSLHIRMHNPGQPVDMHFVPAPQPDLAPSATQPTTASGA